MEGELNMALKLIRRGAWRVPITIAPGTGWVNTTIGGNPYVVEDGPVILSATATGCDGVRIYDWDKTRDLYAEGVSQGGMHACSAHVLGARAVVRVLNPTDKTEVTVTAIPIPPLPRRIFARLGGWLPWR